MSEANKLLMMFVDDLYKSQTGKISKRTARAAVSYVNKDEQLSRLVCIGDSVEILKHESKEQ